MGFHRKRMMQLEDVMRREAEKAKKRPPQRKIVRESEDKRKNDELRKYWSQFTENGSY